MKRLERGDQVERAESRQILRIEHLETLDTMPSSACRGRLLRRRGLVSVECQPDRAIAVRLNGDLPALLVERANEPVQVRG